MKPRGTSSITIDPGRCVKCGCCVEVCPNCVFDWSSEAGQDGVEIRYPEQCCACGHCVAICPEDAVCHKDMPAADFEDLPGTAIAAGSMRDLLLSRRSVRAFREEPVSKELLGQLIEAGTHAGTSSNGQTENFIVLQDRRALSELEELVIDILWKAGLRYLGSGLGRRFAEMKYGGEMARQYMAYHRIIGNRKRDNCLKGMIFRNAPVVIISHGIRANYLAHTNCALATRNMEIMAGTMGLGTCWVGFLTSAAHISRKIGNYLDISTDRNIYGAIMVGYPKHQYKKSIPRRGREVRWI